MQMICRGSKLWKKSTCSVIIFQKNIQVCSLGCKQYDRESIHGGSAELSLAEIHQEMSELLNKQVNAQKEKIFRGSRKLSQAHEKVCDKNERRRRKKTTCV